jgi:hypothetical protein
MSNLIQFRRGTDAQRQAVTLAAGEPAFTTDLLQLWVGDGATPGGIAIGITAAQLAALGWSRPYLALAAAGTTNIQCASPWLNGRFPLSIGAGSGAFVANITLSPTNALAGALVRIPIDFAASVNGTVNFYDGTTAGTLMQTITNIDATDTRSFQFTAGFDGAHWNKETGDWVL